MAAGTYLTLDSPLQPFINPTTKEYYTSNDLVNIETQCGFTYARPRRGRTDDEEDSSDDDHLRNKGEGPKKRARDDTSDDENDKKGKRRRLNPDAAPAPAPGPTRTFRVPDDDSEDDTEELAMVTAKPKTDVWIRVNGLSKSTISGSYLIEVFTRSPDGQRQLVSVESILSRRNPRQCKNCQVNGVASVYMPVYGVTPEDLGENALLDIKIEVDVTLRPGSDLLQEGGDRTTNLKMTDFNVIDGGGKVIGVPLRAIT